MPLDFGLVYVDRLLKELVRLVDTFTGGRAYELPDLFEFVIFVGFEVLILELLESFLPATALLRDDLDVLLPEVTADFDGIPPPLIPLLELVL